MKKKIKYYSIAAILSLVWDGIVVYACYLGIIKHPHDLILNTLVCSLIVILSVILNAALFLQAKENLKPKNQCFVMRLPGVIENDNFEFPKLDLENGNLNKG